MKTIWANRREIHSGGLQWMKSGKGIIHSEMPAPENGLLHGFQIWLNQPALEKMTEPEYCDLSKQQTPEFYIDQALCRVLMGSLPYQDTVFESPIVRPHQDALLIDISTDKQQVSLPLQQEKVMLFVYQGSIECGTGRINEGEFGIFSEQGELVVQAEDNSRFIVLAGKPLNENVVQHGPFVMNSREEILQTIKDYQSGNFP